MLCKSAFFKIRQALRPAAKTARRTKKENTSAKKIVIAAGGSGGHLIPARQLGKACLNQDTKVCFAGKGLQKNPSFNSKEFEFVEVAAGPLKKPFAILKGFFQAVLFLRKYRPHAVVGFGSYHSFPVLLAAVFLRIKLVVFEANAVLGRVNRFFLKNAGCAAIQFPLQAPDKPKNRSQLIKNQHNLQLVRPFPWSSFQLTDQKTARKKLGLAAEMPVLFMFGGSQGADFFNDLICRLAIFWKEEKFFQIVHLTGSQQAAEQVKSLLQKLKINSYVDSYFQNMGLLFSAANIVAARGGAATLCEIVQARKPAVLIPFPFAKDRHQEINADFFENTVKGGKKILQPKLNIKAFAKTLLFLYEHEKDFQKNMRKFQVQTEKEKRKGLDEIIGEML